MGASVDLWFSHRFFSAHPLSVFREEKENPGAWEWLYT